MGGMAAQKIAVIDSDEAFLRFVERFLRLEGFDVYPRSAGHGAVADLRSQRPDLILLDTWIENREAGWSLLDGLFTNPTLRNVPVLITGSDTDELRVRGDVLVRHPRLETLRKPFAPEELLARVRSMLAAPDLGLQLAEQESRAWNPTRAGCSAT
jgi:DNA-binding response OmpR family regulator